MVTAHCYSVWCLQERAHTQDKPQMQSPHSVSGLISTSLVFPQQADPQPITPCRTYKNLARAVKLAEGHYKSQKAFV